MNVEITDRERQLLLELIEKGEQESIQSLDHADSRAFKDLLRARLKLLESTKNKLHDAQVA
jgi:hypothetical protein